MTMIFAHRGFSGYYPENTMLAFQKVTEESLADGIEMDIQLTKDGEIVIMHDEAIDRTTNGSGWLKDYTLAELKTLSVGVNMKGFFPRQTIPTLREYFAWVRTTKLITNIELKTSVFDYPGIEEKLVALVHEYKLENQLWFSSFNHYSVARLQKLLPGANCGLLVDAWLTDAGKYCADRHAATLNASSAFCAQPGIADELHAHGVKLQTWTPNERELLKRLADNNVDVLITNYPDIAAEVIGRK